MFAKNRSFMGIVLRRTLAGGLAAWFALTLVTVSTGGLNNFRNNNVGGISVDVDGVVGDRHAEAAEKLRRVRLERFAPIAADLGAAAGTRRISLKRLEAIIADELKNNISATPFELPQSVQYLGGLQRIEYVFVYPEQGDVVLAGPGEGWKIDKWGNVVGAKSGRPVMLLEDLIVALRYIKSARSEGITCSIDPTEEGRRRLDQFLSRQTTFNPGVIAGIEKTMGMQKITTTGMPAESHLSRVMVASDYRMKRIGMGHEPSLVSGLPSYIDMLKSSRQTSRDLMPRWWLACNYEPLAKAENGLAWQLRGPGVKAMTEIDFISKTGEVRATGAKNPIAQKWAELMTSKYDELSVQDPVFGQLRNVIDLCVVAALIDQEGLLQRANLSLPMLADTDSKLIFEPLLPPRTVPTQCSHLKKGRQHVLTASGGVDIDVWSVIENTETDAKVDQVHRDSAAPQTELWYWN
jgi:hypothetical protein